MQLLPRVQTSLSSLRTSTSESSETLSAVSAGTQDASPSLPYTLVTQSSSSSIGTLRPLPTLRLLPLFSFAALPLLSHQHPYIALGFLIHPPVCLCSRVFVISVLFSHWDSTRSGKVAIPSVLGRTPCEEVETNDGFRYGSSLLIWLYIRYSPFATCITQRAVITIIHPTLATRSGTTQRQVGVTSQAQGGEEQESEEQESKAQGGAERGYGAELENGNVLYRRIVVLARCLVSSGKCQEQSIMWRTPR
jgi:hypothetical protein